MRHRPWLDLLLDVGAAYRLTRLVTSDALTEGLRERVIERGARRASLADDMAAARRYGPEVAEAGGPLAYLIECPWCTSIYVGVGVAVARRLAPLPWSHAARALTLSAITGWLSERS